LVLVRVTPRTVKLIGNAFMRSTAPLATDVLTLSGSNVIVTDVTGPELTTTSIAPLWNLASKNGRVYAASTAVNAAAIAVAARV
jgi:hypothetical protein